MVKHRFSTHDVAAEVGCLKQKFLGMRLANIYDINAKVHCLFAAALIGLMPSILPSKA